MKGDLKFYLESRLTERRMENHLLEKESPLYVQAQAEGAGDVVEESVFPECVAKGSRL